MNSYMRHPIVIPLLHVICVRRSIRIRWSISIAE